VIFSPAPIRFAIRFIRIAPRRLSKRFHEHTEDAPTFTSNSAIKALPSAIGLTQSCEPHCLHLFQSGITRRCDELHRRAEFVESIGRVSRCLTPFFYGFDRYRQHLRPQAAAIRWRGENSPHLSESRYFTPHYAARIRNLCWAHYAIDSTRAHHHGRVWRSRQLRGSGASATRAGCAPHTFESLRVACV
jgi:hypothetical protein